MTPMAPHMPADWLAPYGSLNHVALATKVGVQKSPVQRPAGPPVVQRPAGPPAPMASVSPRG